MDARAPAVVAVVVADDPGAWFDETLASLAVQDYEELAVLVLVPAGAGDPSERVAAALPHAFVRSSSARRFGPAVNEVLSTVEGATFYLLCHDDVALEPSAVRLLVEESFRSNAALVVPKTTTWDDPSVLLHVGQGVDKTGAVVDRVQPGEVDHGQHDSVRDVFAAPGGCVLVRADLFAELGGFDEGIEAVGEDVDLSWRAHVAGARVVVAPDACVRHREALLNGARQLDSPRVGAGRPGRTGRGRHAGRPPVVDLERLRRRHELRSALKCYSLPHLLRVLPQMALLATVELLASLVAGDGPRASAVAGAWTWNLRRGGELRHLRRAVRAQRAVGDRQVRRLQAPGSVRLTTFLTQLANQGFELVRGQRGLGQDPAQIVAEPELTGSVGGAFSEDASFDEISDVSRVRRTPFLSTPRARLVAWLVVVVFLIVGSRHLLGSGLPVVGDLLPLPSWSGAWHLWATSWQPAGVGTTQPTTPAFAVLGVTGTALFGGMGLVQKVLVLGCVPVGAWGLVRFLRPLCSPRGRLAAGVAYLGLPLAYDALARGRWDGLVAFAVTPWLLARVCRASRIEPFEPAPGWRGSLPGQMLLIGVVELVAIGFAPGVAPVVLLIGLAVPLGSLATGRPGGGRGLVAAVGGTLIAALLCLPWVIGVLGAGHAAPQIFGLPPGSSPSWSSLLRFDVGPVGGSALSWFLLAASLLPLLVGVGVRLGWAARLWALALMSWLLAWAVGNGWTGGFTPTLDVLLVPAACAVAANIGIGLSAFERDLGRYQFGWRQLVTVVAVAAAGVGLLPVIVEAGGGRWGLPDQGIEQATAFLGAHPWAGGQRTLWLAAPEALPGGGWSVEPGLAFATTEGGAPGPSNLWAPAGAGPAAVLADAVRAAESGRTSQLGQLLAVAGVRYVVVLQALAPAAPGVQSVAGFPTPADLVPALDQQDDLRLVPGGEGFTVYADTARQPVRAQRAALLGPVSSSGPWPTRSDVLAWRGRLPGPAAGTVFAGPVRTGPLVVLSAPASRWNLSVGGSPVGERPAYGWAAQYPRTGSGAAVLAFAGSPWNTLGIVFEAVCWILVAAVLLLVGRRRTREWWAAGRSVEPREEPAKEPAKEPA